MFLAGLFDFHVLYNPDADNDYVCAFGHHDLKEARRVATDLIQSQYDRDLAGDEFDEPCRFDVVSADHEMFWNDRALAELEGVACYYNHEGDIEWSEWQTDTDHIDELMLPAELDDEGFCTYCGETPCETTNASGRCRGEEMRPDWQAIVQANPDRYPLAPIGPFPCTMVVFERTYLEDGEPAGNLAVVE